MKVSIGADHAGFLLKERLRRKLAAEGHQVTDRGANGEASCDYPEFAAAVGRDVSGGAAERLVDTFLSVEFLAGRHARRVALIAKMESND